MSRIIQQIEIEGQTIWVEMDDVALSAPAATRETSRFSNTSVGSDVAQRAADTIKKVDLSSTLAAIVGPVRKALTDFQPDEVTVELSLGFKAEAGVFVASGEASGQIKVSAKWKPAASKA
jgi:hypothetical protein